MSATLEAGNWNQNYPLSEEGFLLDESLSQEQQVVATRLAQLQIIEDSAQLASVMPHKMPCLASQSSEIDAQKGQVKNRTIIFGVNERARSALVFEEIVATRNRQIDSVTPESTCVNRYIFEGTSSLQAHKITYDQQLNLRQQSKVEFENVWAKFEQLLNQINWISLCEQAQELVQMSANIDAILEKEGSLSPIQRDKLHIQRDGLHLPEANFWATWP